MRILITGSTGYIGSHLTYLVSKRGHDLIMASRRKPSATAASWLPYDLSSDDAVMLPVDTAAVVHLAANTTHDNSLDKEGEVIAARRLIESAQEVGARFIFVSSQTARPDAPSAYGRTKWRIEQEVLSAGGWVVRPGLVYGGCERGLFGILAGVVRQLPGFPLLYPHPKYSPFMLMILQKGY